VEFPRHLGLAQSVALGLVVAACADRPPQTGQYCLDLPNGGKAEAREFANAVAERLELDVSEGTFEFEPGNVGFEFLIYGRGVSLSFGRSLVSGPADAYGNRLTIADPKRYSLHAYKDGLWQRIQFDEVIAAAEQTAEAKGLVLEKASNDSSCATTVSASEFADLRRSASQ
jgi:hypothetical protein